MQIDISEHRVELTTFHYWCGEVRPPTTSQSPRLFDLFSATNVQHWSKCQKTCTLWSSMSCSVVSHLQHWSQKTPEPSCWGKTCLIDLFVLIPVISWAALNLTTLISSFWCMSRLWEQNIQMCLSDWCWLSEENKGTTGNKWINHCGQIMLKIFYTGVIFIQY